MLTILLEGQPLDGCRQGQLPGFLTVVVELAELLKTPGNRSAGHGSTEILRWRASAGMPDVVPPWGTRSRPAGHPRRGGVDIRQLAAHSPLWRTMLRAPATLSGPQDNGEAPGPRPPDRAPDSSRSADRQDSIDDDAKTGTGTTRPAGGDDRGRASAWTVHRVPSKLRLRLESRGDRGSARRPPPHRRRPSRRPLRDLPRRRLREGRGARRLGRQFLDVRGEPLLRLGQGPPGGERGCRRDRQPAARAHGDRPLRLHVQPWSAMP
jgi:hypothetical protein